MSAWRPSYPHCHIHQYTCSHHLFWSSTVGNTGQGHISFSSQVRPVTWSKLLKHGRKFLPHPGKLGSDREEQTDCTAWPQKAMKSPIWSSNKKGRSDAQRNPFCTPITFPKLCQCHPACFTALQWIATKPHPPLQGSSVSNCKRWGRTGIRT